MSNHLERLISVYCTFVITVKIIQKTTILEEENIEIVNVITERYVDY